MSLDLGILAWDLPAPVPKSAVAARVILVASELPRTSSEPDADPSLALRFVLKLLALL